MLISLRALRHKSHNQIVRTNPSAFRNMTAMVTEVLPPSEEQPQPPPDNTVVTEAQAIEMQVIDPQV